MGVVIRRGNKVGNPDSTNSNRPVVQEQRHRNRRGISYKPTLCKIANRTNRILLELGFEKGLITDNRPNIYICPKSMIITQVYNANFP